MSLFGSNPFTTPVGQRIERATAGSLASEDWGLNIEICDIINETEDGPKDAIKALKKKLIANKNWKEVMYTLTVLETCVKNCGHRFHTYACKQEFVKELVKIMQPNLNPPTGVQEKILSLIQSWADAFRSKPDLQGVVRVYEELKQKGIEFPATNLDELSPIVTPQRGTPEVNASTRRSAPTRQNSNPQQLQQPQQQPLMMGPAPNMIPVGVPPNMQQQQQQQQQPPAAPAMAGLSPDQLAKLRRDLEVVLGNVKVMSEMLTEMVPGQGDPGDLQLLQDLNKTCRAMQLRLVELIGSIGNEEVTGELLRVNDDLNNVFVRYDRFERYRASQASQQPAVASMPEPVPSSVNIVPPSYGSAVASPAQPPAQPLVQPPAAPTAVLIDFGAGDPAPTPTAYPQPVNAAPDSLSLQLGGLGLSGDNAYGNLAAQPPMNAAQPETTDEFDMFAQSRQTSYTDSRKSGSTYQDILNLDQSGVTMGNLVNARANPLSAAPVAQPAQDVEEMYEGLPPGVDADEMEQWLNATDLEKQKDELSVQNTNSQPDAGITSSEFDQFLQTRAKAGETLPPTQTNPTHQMKMDNAENTMFAL